MPLSHQELSRKSQIHMWLHVWRHNNRNFRTKDNVSHFGFRKPRHLCHQSPLKKCDWIIYENVLSKVSLFSLWKFYDYKCQCTILSRTFIKQIFFGKDFGQYYMRLCSLFLDYQDQMSFINCEWQQLCHKPMTYFVVLLCHLNNKIPYIFLTFFINREKRFVFLIDINEKWWV